MPADVVDSRLKRVYVQRAGLVWFGRQNTLGRDYQQRLNEAAYLALFNVASGGTFVLPAKTATGP